MKTIVTPELNQTFSELAALLVTPERYGRLVLAQTIPVENLGGLYDEPAYYGD